MNLCLNKTQDILTLINQVDGFLFEPPLPDHQDAKEWVQSEAGQQYMQIQTYRMIVKNFMCRRLAAGLMDIKEYEELKALAKTKNGLTQIAHHTILSATATNVKYAPVTVAESVILNQPKQVRKH